VIKLEKHIKKLAATVGTAIGAAAGNAIGASIAVPTTSIWAVALGGAMLGTSVLLGGGAIVGGVICYKLAKRFLAD
jgi:hypothetical protein